MFFLERVGLDCFSLIVPSVAVILAIGVVSPTTAQPSSFEQNTGRPGRDYRDFEMGAALCMSICLGEQRCRAWTYVRPGLAGPLGHCSLKDSVPQATHDPCCISGVKGRPID